MSSIGISNQSGRYKNMNECARCGDEYEPYLVFIRDDITDIVSHLSTDKDWKSDEDDNNGLCKPCRMAVTDHGAYLTESEREELEPKHSV